MAKSQTGLFCDIKTHHQGKGPNNVIFIFGLKKEAVFCKPTSLSQDEYSGKLEDYSFRILVTIIAVQFFLWFSSLFRFLYWIS